MSRNHVHFCLYLQEKIAASLVFVVVVVFFLLGGGGVRSVVTELLLCGTSRLVFPL